MDKMEYIDDNLKSLEVEITTSDLKEIDEALANIKIEGERLNKDLLSLSEE